MSNPSLTALLGLSQQVNRLQRRNNIPASIELQGPSLSVNTGTSVYVSWNEAIRNVGNTFTWPASASDPINIFVAQAGLYLFNIKLGGPAATYQVILYTSYDGTTAFSRRLGNFLTSATLTENVFTTTAYLYENTYVAMQIVNNSGGTIVVNTGNVFDTPYLTIVNLSPQWDSLIGAGTHCIRTAVASIANSTTTSLQWQSIPASYEDAAVRQYYGFNNLLAYNTLSSTGTQQRVPQTGTYLVNAIITWDSAVPGTTQGRLLSLLRTTTGSVQSVIAVSQVDATATGTLRPLCISIVIDLIVGDVVEVRVFHNAGVGLNVVIAGTPYVVNSFNLVLLSL